MILDYSMAQRRWIVSVFDSAVDLEKSKTLEYLQEGHPENWKDYLVLKEGKEPVLWQVRPLDVDERAACRSGYQYVTQDGRTCTDQDAMHKQAFRRAVTGWTNLQINKDGRVIDFSPVFVDVNGVEILKDDVVKELSKLAGPIVDEFGALALRKSVMDLKAKN